MQDNVGNSQIKATPTQPPMISPAHFRTVVSFDTRSRRLNNVQRRAWNLNAGRWYVDSNDYAGGIALDQIALFGRKAPLVLEIGCGMGESTAAMARARPALNFLALEVYNPGIAQTLSHLARQNVNNVRVMRGDAASILINILAPASLAAILIFFPDPWPKTRHKKRRLVDTPFIETAASRMQPRGKLLLSTDWAPYAGQMLKACSAAGDLQNKHEDFAPRPSCRPITRYEQRGIQAGRAIFDLEFTRA